MAAYNSTEQKKIVAKFQDKVEENNKDQVEKHKELMQKINDKLAANIKQKMKKRVTEEDHDQAKNKVDEEDKQPEIKKAEDAGQPADDLQPPSDDKGEADANPDALGSPEDKKLDDNYHKLES